MINDAGEQKKDEKKDEAADDAGGADDRLVAGAGLPKARPTSLQLSSSLFAGGRAQKRQRNWKINNFASTKLTQQVDVVRKSQREKCGDFVKLRECVMQR